jgi:hypothetical protein
VKRVPFTGRITAEERAAILAKFGTIAGAMRFLIQAAGATGPALPVAPRTDFEEPTPVVRARADGRERWCERCRRVGVPSCPACVALSRR